MRGPRTQAERDAQTVEIGFALLTGALLAGLVLLVFIGVLGLMAVGFGPRSPSAWSNMLQLAGCACVTVFVGRVVYVLMRAPGGRLSDGTPDEDGAVHPDDEGVYPVDGPAEGAGPAGAARAGGADFAGDFAGEAGGAGPQPSQPGRTSPDS